MSLKSFLRSARARKKLSRYTSQAKSILENLAEASLEDLQEKSKKIKDLYSNGKISDQKLEEDGIKICSASIINTLGYSPYECQIAGAYALSSGNIVEMGTGEGKTLTAIMASYLNYLKGESTHIVTVNDYLSSRDASLSKSILSPLGVNIGWVSPNQPFDDKQEAYKKDIVYGTTQSFGFDFLRNYLTVSANEVLGQKRENVIIDEVDSILIDEARVPLGISSDIDREEESLKPFNELAIKILSKESNYKLDHQKRRVLLTEAGYSHLESLVLEHQLVDNSQDLYGEGHGILFKIENALLANSLYINGVDYIVNDEAVIPIDQETGRLQKTRKWRGGLHEAIEEKENLSISKETMTVLSTTIQNMYLKYKSISGMTGTAKHNADEYESIYGLDTIIIPPNKRSQRVDLEDKIYPKKHQKHIGILQDVKGKHKEGRPVLICTTSVEESKEISDLLNKNNLKHSVLNAENHKNEAAIIKNAGQKGAITVSTNMAGRGSDIVLGGDYEKVIMKAKMEGLSSEESESLWKSERDYVNELGGLHVIGVQHYDTRRADHQMRGRCGRQGDNGSTRIYVSLDDNIFKMVGNSSSYQKIFSMVGVGDYGIESTTIRQAIERIQRKIEGSNYDRRQYLVKYDNIDAEQRNLYFSYRENLLGLYDVSGYIVNIIDNQFKGCVTDADYQQRLDELELPDSIKYDLGDKNKICEKIYSALENKLSSEPENIKLMYYKQLCLEVLKKQWANHIQDLMEIKSAVSHRVTANKNPYVEYKIESNQVFSKFFDKSESIIIKELFQNEIKKSSNRESLDVEDQIRKVMSEKVKTKSLQFSKSLITMMETSVEYGIKF